MQSVAVMIAVESFEGEQRGVYSRRFQAETTRVPRGIAHSCMEQGVIA